VGSSDRGSARRPALVSLPERTGPTDDLGTDAVGRSVVGLGLGAEASEESLDEGFMAAGRLETLGGLAAAPSTTLGLGLMTTGPLETLGSFGWGAVDLPET
jgi:hypothetical protein